MTRKNKIFSDRSSGFEGFGSKEKKDDQKGCFNYEKLGHFIVECPELQKHKPNKGSFQKDNFKNRFKKNLVATLGELDNEENSENDEEQVNLALVAFTSLEAESDSDSGSNYEEEDEDLCSL
ncbi:hypothetical protein KIW84_015705 [Lathyrus oleraceus]|uniref:Uncharacterized protein n=1 Tax=Pisum sativum TaxID=3888 RepID=A0A9D5BR14_PEA|nr:hypothetical protein KIW84_015705 [Pisum sativum]